MRHILVTNAKGGCGKSTVATNLAAYYASQGCDTALADYDPQASALSWLEERPEEQAPITGLAAFDDGLRHLPRNTGVPHYRRARQSPWPGAYCTGESRRGRSSFRSSPRPSI